MLRRRVLGMLFMTVSAACASRRSNVAGGGPTGGAGQAPPRPDIPNRTKVVRLIVLPTDINANNVEAVRTFATAQGAAKADVFIVKNSKGEWHPMSWLGDALVDHETAVRRDRESTVFTMVTAREQVQWESSVDFRVVSIAKKASIKETSLINRGDGPDDAFDRRPKDAKGGPGRPIRSGPPTLRDGKMYDQLYKATFAMMLEGKEVIIDPDMYCDYS